MWISNNRINKNINQVFAILKHEREIYFEILILLITYIDLWMRLQQDKNTRVNSSNKPYLNHNSN